MNIERSSWRNASRSAKMRNSGNPLVASENETGSLRFSVEWEADQPEGRQRIAQRFIAGAGRGRMAPQSRRDGRNRALRSWSQEVLSSLRDFRAAGTSPSDESLGYFRSSLRDAPPAAGRLNCYRGDYFRPRNSSISFKMPSRISNSSFRASATIFSGSRFFGATASSPACDLCR